MSARQSGIAGGAAQQQPPGRETAASHGLYAIGAAGIFAAMLPFPTLPAPPRFGARNIVPTLNGTGFMFEVLDGYASSWIQQADGSNAPLLEIGCAYGVATIAALEAGAQVVACDMEPAHLQILRSRAPAALHARLDCVAGRLPEVEFRDGRFAAILCSRVLHFLSGPEIDAAVAAMARWLRPGGHLYLVSDTPYGIWRNFIPDFEAAKQAGARWPGMMHDPCDRLPTPGIARYLGRPAFMNLLDPGLLARSCSEAGLQVMRAGFIDRRDFRGLAALDGRENAGVMAIRPPASRPDIGNA